MAHAACGKPSFGCPGGSGKVRCLRCGLLFSVQAFKVRCCSVSRRSHSGQLGAPAGVQAGPVPHLASDQSSPLRLSLQGLLRKLRLLRNLNPCLEVKRLVLQSLVHAALFWASGVVSPAEADLLALRTEIRSLLSLHFTEEAPWILITAVHGWDFDPLWVRDWRAILAAWRFVATPPLWLETAPIVDACQPWALLVPEASKVMARLNWFASRDGRSIHRIDDSGCLTTVKSDGIVCQLSASGSPKPTSSVESTNVDVCGNRFTVRILHARVACICLSLRAPPAMLSADTNSLGSPDRLLCGAPRLLRLDPHGIGLHSFASPEARLSGASAKVSTPAGRI